MSFPFLILNILIYVSFWIDVKFFFLQFVLDLNFLSSLYCQTTDVVVCRCWSLLCVHSFISWILCESNIIIYGYVFFHFWIHLNEKWIEQGSQFWKWNVIFIFPVVSTFLDESALCKTFFIVDHPHLKLSKDF